MFHVKLEEMLFEDFYQNYKELLQTFNDVGEKNTEMYYKMSPMEKYKAKRAVVMALNDLIIKSGLVENYVEWRKTNEKHKMFVP